jgi:hypothetical protein
LYAEPYASLPVLTPPIRSEKWQAGDADHGDTGAGGDRLDQPDNSEIDSRG